MPAEHVYGIGLPPGSGPEEAPNIVPIVDVRWSRDGTVQIVSKATDAFGGRAVGDSFEGISYLDGFHVDLDRLAINNLIRHLRRARDQAFGRDE